MRYFYSTKTKLKIIDVSGKKLIAEITKDYGGLPADYQILDLTPAEELTHYVSSSSGSLKKEIIKKPVDTSKEDYVALANTEDRIDFIAKKLGLT